ncbi:MAG: hypothetical protein JXQ84_07800 [Rhodospirillaceae bacterium]|nr:hypothetical protein [Rhodospirillaceae bacterium]
MPDDPRFTAALALVLQHEGGFTNDPADPGGATQYGISLRTVVKVDADMNGLLDFDLDGDGDVDVDDIKALTPEAAAAYYRHQWWDKFGYGQIKDDHIAAKVFDLAVNMGAKQAHICLQRALRAAWLPTLEDGVLGPNTMRSVNAADPRSLLAALKAEAAGFYRLLSATKTFLARYREGWLTRAYS